MPGTARRESELLAPLSAFYRRQGASLPKVEIVAPDEVPEPCRTLLVHEADMTSALQRFHGHPIELQVLLVQQDDSEMRREVILTAGPQCRPVEFGAIVIHLHEFDAEARELIVQCRRPLGAILRERGIAHVSRPAAFIRLTSDGIMNTAMNLNASHELYGRCNVLHGGNDRVLAEVVEILPPV
jgi:chorismate-pyruvate lyase